MKPNVSQCDHSTRCKGRPRAPRVNVHGVSWWAPRSRVGIMEPPPQLVGQSCSFLRKRKSDFLRGWLTKCHLFSDLGPAALPLRPRLKWGKSPVSRATRVYEQLPPGEGSLRCGNTLHRGPERRRTSLFQLDFHKLSRVRSPLKLFT